jgi:hypothetical protein
LGVSAYDLLQIGAPFIGKEVTGMRNAITTSQRLSATVCFLATGQVFEDLQHHNQIFQSFLF